MLLASVLAYGIALWLGLYLIMRDPSKPILHLAGWGLVAYALALTTLLLQGFAQTQTLAAALERIHSLVIPIPALLWGGALLRLQQGQPGARWLWRVWLNGFLPATVILLLILAGSGLPIGFADPIGLASVIFMGLIFPPLLGALVLLIGNRAAIGPRRSTGLLLAGLIFFGLSTVLIITPLHLLPDLWLMLGTGIDLLLLGIAIAALDAFDEGEVLLPDMVHSFDAALLAGTLFGGQAALAMFLATGVTFAMLVLLLGLVAGAILLVTFTAPLQRLVDSISLAAFPDIQTRRSELREASRAEVRVDAGFEGTSVAPEQFERLTRRALGYLGDLPRLAKSPLTRLPIVEQRLAKRGITPDTLARAKELKALLTESIARLKPRGEAEFGTTDAWRYYNALHFPYVRGLKPYSRRFIDAEEDGIDREALEWLRTQVPERTLYNWQNAAAALIAQDLRDQS